MRKIMKSTAGFGVMEAMLFSGLATVVVLGTASMVTRNSWQVKLMNVKIARDSMASTIRSQLADALVCSSALNNTTPLLLNTLPQSMELAFTLVGGKTTIRKDFQTNDKQLVVNSFRIENIRNAGLTGAHGFPMQVGELILDAQSPEAGIGTTTLKPASLGPIYIEANGQTIVQCFNADGPYGAAAMACLQFGGLNTGDINDPANHNAGCDNTPFVNGILSSVKQQVDDELAQTYTPFVMGQTDGMLLDAGSTAYKIIKDASDANVGQQTSDRNQAINTGYTQAANTTAAYDANRAVQVQNLWNSVNATTNTANAAQSYATQARDIANASLALGTATNQSAAATENGARNVFNTANLANSYAQSALAVSNQAASYANSAAANANQAANYANAANGTAQYANNQANYANYVANTAANSAQQAYNYGTSAYNTANWANSTAQNAYNTSNWASSTANSANSTASWAFNQAYNAANTAQAAYYRPANVNNINQTQWDCSQMYGTACP